LPFCRCRFHLPLRRNRCSVKIGSNPIFAVLPQMDNQSAFWSLHPYVYAARKDVSSNSVLTGNGNGSYGTEERQRNVTTTAPHN